MPDGGALREDARRLLRAAYERRVAVRGRVTQVDLAAVAGEGVTRSEDRRLAALMDYMQVMGWVEADPFAGDPTSDAVRRITVRGLKVVREG